MLPINNTEVRVWRSMYTRTEIRWSTSTTFHSANLAWNLAVLVGLIYYSKKWFCVVRCFSSEYVAELYIITFIFHLYVLAEVFVDGCSRRIVSETCSLVCTYAASISVNYQWQFKPVNSEEFTVLENEIRDTLVFEPLTYNDEGVYRCLVTTVYEDEISGDKNLTLPCKWWNVYHDAF